MELFIETRKSLVSYILDRVAQWHYGPEPSGSATLDIYGKVLSGSIGFYAILEILEKGDM